MSRWKITVVNVQEKRVAYETYNTELAAKTAAEIWNNRPKIKQVRINGKVYKKSR